LSESEQPSDQEESHDPDAPLSAHDHSATVHLPHRRHASPWSNRAVLVVSLLIGLVLAPLWLDPVTLGELTGVRSSPTPEVSPSPAKPVNRRPASIDPSAPARTLAQDSFARRVVSGWGAADFGGAYAVTGPPDRLVVEAGVGLLSVTPAGGVEVVLPGAVGRDVELSFSFASAMLPAQAELAVHALLRDAEGGNLYRPTVHLFATGPATVTIELVTDGVMQPLGGPIVVPDVVAMAGTPVRVRAKVSGSDPTTIRVRAWPATGSEPRYWDLTVADWTSSLQAAGAPGLGWQLAGVPVDSSVVVQVDDLLITTTDPAPLE
jgi:hypothetical protein